MSGPWRWLGWLCLAPVCAVAAEQPTPAPVPSPPLPPLRERLRQPLGSPRTMGRPGETAQLRFEETVNVTAPPLDFARLRAEWTRHWNLSGRERAETGPPGHPEMREQSRRLSELYGTPQSASLPIISVLAAAGQAIAKGVKRKAMPPADRRPAPTEKPAPLEVDLTEDAQPTPTPTPGSEPPEFVRRPSK